jgi:ABC-type transport system substrate-binding protein
MMLRYTLPVFETLLRISADQKILPWLADSWDIAPDGKSITFRLHPGIKFHDGTDFNADAVKYNLEQMVAGGIRGTAVLKNITSYSILDPMTIRFNLAQFDATLLIRLAETGIGQMGSPTALKKPTTSDTQAFDHMVGTGPFLLDSWQRDNVVKFKKNPNYWRKGQPYLDYLVLKNVTDLTVSIMAFKAGDADALENPDPVDAKQLDKEGFKIYQPALRFYHAWVTDGSNPNSPFADKRVRQALEYAVDRKTMALGIGMGYYEALYQAATTSAPWYDSTLAPREYNPAKAKQLLAEAGYPNGFTTKIVSDVRVRKDTLVAVQTYLKAVGINADLDIADVARASTLTMKGWEGLLFPGFPTAGTFVGLQGRYGVTTDYVSFYRPPGWQDKWAAMLTQTDDAKRMQQFKELVKVIYDEANISFYQADAPIMALIPGRVNGFELHTAMAADYYTPETIWLSKK